MRIGVVADTHSRDLPQQMLKEFKTVDLIVHAGDFCDMKVANALKKIKPLEGVFGNMDDEKIRKVFPRRKILKLGDARIGLFHGEGAPQKVLESVQKEFKQEDVQAVIFGHSHEPFNEKKDNVLYFNPGSPNDSVFAPYLSFGILDLNKDGIKSRIIKIEDSNG